MDTNVSFDTIMLEALQANIAPSAISAPVIPASQADVAEIEQLWKSAQDRVRKVLDAEKTARESLGELGEFANEYGLSEENVKRIKDGAASVETSATNFAVDAAHGARKARRNSKVLKQENLWLFMEMSKIIDEFETFSQSQVESRLEAALYLRALAAKYDRDREIIDAEITSDTINQLLADA